METKSNDEVRAVVRDHYGKVATSAFGVGCAPGCCGATKNGSERLGYSTDDVASVPDGADMGLGCGNPQAIAALRPGESVLDLGSGGGFDCFLAARQVGPTGRVIGVDMTTEMVSKARNNARKIGAENVEFRLGEIEHLPVTNDSIDVILSNCVINLSPNKAAVFREAFRVLRPGGRLAIADVVAKEAIPAALSARIETVAGCIAGAARVDELLGMLADSGFEDVRIEQRLESREFIRDWIPGSGAEDYITSAVIHASRPKTRSCCGPSCCEV